MVRMEYRKKRKLSTKWMVGGLISALLMIVSSIILLIYPFASTEKKTYFHGKYPILFNGQQQGNASFEGHTLFVPLTFLKKQIDSTISFDEKSKSIIITTKDKVIQMPTDSLTYFINQKPINLQISPVLIKNGEILVSLDPILSLYPIQYKRLAESDAVWIQRDGEDYKNGKLIDKDINPEKIRLRTEPTWQSPYVAEMKKKEAILLEGEKDGFYLIRKTNGISGYIKKEYVQVKDNVHITIRHESKVIPTVKIPGPIQLTWEAVYTKNPDSTKIPAMQGVNVVAPTWFKLASSDGTINNLASLEYSKWAKLRGYQVWGVFSNSFDPKLSHEAFKDFGTRQTIIRQLLQFSQMYQLQGINFDIENVNPEDGQFVTQFMREVTPYLHEAGLVVSMDITFSAGENNNWSSFYERKKLAQSTDYLIVMAYDEHTGASSEAGSVASMPWVESNLQKLLAEVPNNQLILGVPLYARLWKEQTKADGTVEISAQALSMGKVKEWLAEKGVTPTYDEASGQNYAEYPSESENAIYKIWIEDELSLKKRAELASKYQLAGIGTWSRFFGDPSAWVALDLNKAVTKK